MGWYWQNHHRSNSLREKYDSGIIELGLAFTAKAYCSCLFVTENSEKDCLEYASLKQVSPDLIVDYEKKEVQSKLFLIFSKKAKFNGAESGCIAL